MSIRTKLAMAVTGLVLVVVPTTNYLMSRKQAEVLSHNLKTKGELLTKTVATTCANAIIGGDYVFLERTIHLVVEDPDVVFGAILNKDREIIVYVDKRAGDKHGAVLTGATDRRGERVEDSIVDRTLTSGSATEVVVDLEASFDGIPILDLAMPVDIEAGELKRRWGMVRFGLSRQTALAAIKRLRTATLQQSGLFVILGILIAVLLANRITRPIQALVTDALEIAEGNLENAITLPRARDETFTLATTFEDMRQSLIRQMEQLSLKERLEAELKTAQTIQMTLLPNENPTVAGYDIAGACVTASEVGGDYYDFMPFRKDGLDYLGLAVGDVNGHGVAAGLIMAVAKACLRTQIGVNVHPKDILRTLNRVVHESAQRKLLMTFFYCLVDLRNRTFYYSNAGHNFPYVFYDKKDALEELEVGGRPLGFDVAMEYVEQKITLDSGDLLVLYTDGLVEAEDEHGEVYGYERLERQIRQNRLQGAAEIVSALVEDGRTFAGDALPEDDISVIVVKVR